MNPKEALTIKPLGREFSLMAKAYLQHLQFSLKALEIDRNYLALLYIHEENGRITQQELADKLEIDKVSMLRSIKYLGQKGYIVRKSDPHDKRKLRLALTPKASEIIPEIESAFIRCNTLALQGISNLSECYRMLNQIKLNLNTSALW